MTQHEPVRPGMDLAEWYPLLIEANIPTPRTTIIRTDIDLTLLMDGVTPTGFDDLVNRITAAADDIGYPCFLRTGHGSGKHQWSSTCHLRSPADVTAHVASLVDWSFTVDFFGLPTNTWVIRELLPVEAPFLAFKNMPIAKERRYFLDNTSHVAGHHPYWPNDALKASQPHLADTSTFLLPADWNALLDGINHEPEHEVAELTSLTQRVGAVVPGAWSVDWLWSPGRGWICIDMAHAERSYIWTDHPNAPNSTSAP